MVDQQKIYVRPIGLGRGTNRLAGGWQRFDAVQLLNRQGVLFEGSLEDAQRELADHPSATYLRRLVATPSPFAGLDLTQAHIMGILNVTPDSFSDGGEALALETAKAKAEAMIAGGASIIDIGGESTRPGAAEVSIEEEIARVLPSIQTLAIEALISIDSRNAATLSAALTSGASIINDVTALSHDPNSLGVAVEHQAPTVLMHMQGAPQTMQANPHYQNVVLDVFDYLEAQVVGAVQAGLPRRKLCLDPGIGFGKTLEHNLTLLNALSLFHTIGCPLMLGASRKSFISQISGPNDAKDRLGGSMAATSLGLQHGVQIHRVHDVFAQRQFADVALASMQQATP